jgi:hypothetical protein
VLAAAQAELERVDAVVRAAEAEPTRPQARKTQGWSTSPSLTAALEYRPERPGHRPLLCRA